MKISKFIYCLIFVALGNYSFAQDVNEAANKYFGAAINFAIKGDIDNAITNYEHAIKEAPNFSDALYNLGAIYYNKGLEMTGSVKSDDPTYANMKKEAEANYNKAAEYFERVVAINPQDGLTLNSLKEIYKTTEQFEKAAVVKKKLDALPPPPAAETETK